MLKNKLEVSNIPVKIIFDRLSKLSSLTQNASVLLITSKGSIERGKSEDIKKLISPSEFNVWSDVSPNPTISELEFSLSSLKDHIPEVIIAFGGGSVIDSAKVIKSAFCRKALTIESLVNGTENNEAYDDIELIAIPTTAGTGSEVTPFATIWDDKNNSKLSLHGTQVFPTFALIDGQQCLSLDKNNTLYTALDSISHCLESLWNKNSNENSRFFAFSSLELSSSNLSEVLNHPKDVRARDNISRASTLSGLAISSTKTAVAHSISYPLTSIYGVPHGLACSFTLKHLLEINLESLSKNNGELKILSNILLLLDEIDFKGHLNKYLDVDELLSLSKAMSHPDRIKNYSGKEFQSVKNVLVSSLK